MTTAAAPVTCPDCDGANVDTAATPAMCNDCGALFHADIAAEMQRNAAKDQWGLALALLRNRAQTSGITPEMEAHYRAVIADVERYWRAI